MMTPSESSYSLASSQETIDGAGLESTTIDQPISPTSDSLEGSDITVPIITLTTTMRQNSVLFMPPNLHEDARQILLSQYASQTPRTKSTRRKHRGFAILMESESEQCQPGSSPGSRANGMVREESNDTSRDMGGGSTGIARLRAHSRYEQPRDIRTPESWIPVIDHEDQPVLANPFHKKSWISSLLGCFFPNNNSKQTQKQEIEKEMQENIRADTANRKLGRIVMEVEIRTDARRWRRHD